MGVVRETDIPAIIHTLESNKEMMSNVFKDNYEESNVNFIKPSLDAETAKMDTLSIDLEVIDEVRLADERVVIDHANTEVTEHVLETTDCYVGFSVSALWLRKLDPETIASVIVEYGSDRMAVQERLVKLTASSSLTASRGYAAAFT